MRLRFLLLSVLFVAASPARAGIVLNEIFYDPEGPDEGHEFVELWNGDSTAVPLDGISVESGDGSRPGVWTTLYVGASGDVAPPRGVFLIPASSLRAPIQNGPDALRLTRGGAVLDLVGYGDLAAPELFEGSPAPDAPSGQSLARVQDGVDTDSNAADWAPEPEPTPGQANHPDVRIAFARARVALDPEVPWPEETVSLTVGIRNRGRLPVAGEQWRVEAGAFAVIPGVTLPSGESASVRCSFPAPAPGVFEIPLVLHLDEAIADTLALRSRAGAGPLLLSEIAFHDRGAGEWVEAVARQEIPDLGVFALSDRSGRPYGIASARGVRAGEILVFAESPAALRAAYALPESLVLGTRGGWPALNDSDGEDGIADRVRLIGPDGILSDAAPYRAESVERDASLERLGEALPSSSFASWSECIDPRGGTPGGVNSMRAPEAQAADGRLLLASSPVLTRGSPVVLSFGAAARGARVRVMVHDLLGRARRHLAEGQRVVGEAAFVWDGRDDEGEPVPAGAYVARAETIPDHGEPARTGNLALTVLDR